MGLFEEGRRVVMGGYGMRRCLCLKWEAVTRGRWEEDKEEEAQVSVTEIRSEGRLG